MDQKRVSNDDDDESPFIHDSTVTIHAMVHVCITPTTHKSDTPWDQSK